MKKLFLFALILLSPSLFGACSGVIGQDCTDNLDCPEGTSCVDGACEGGVECITDEDCDFLSPIAVCVDGLCLDP